MRLFLAALILMVGTTPAGPNGWIGRGPAFRALATASRI